MVKGRMKVLGTERNPQIEEKIQRIKKRKEKTRPFTIMKLRRVMKNFFKIS